MCGIGGILLNTDKTNGSEKRIIAQLAHRGPSTTGEFHDQRLHLFHTRLSIIDIEGGNQPLFSPDGNCVLIANGEIYNHVELREKLIAKGYTFSTHSDCETILHAYAEYGLDFLDHLQGMFAFALYDIEQQRLLLARDRLGIKPLYLSHTSMGWVFASEIKAIRPLLAEPQVNIIALGEYFQGKFSRGRETLFTGVERILPGEAVSFDLSKEIPQMKRWRYWKLNCNAQFASDDFEGAARYFDRLMMQVMEQHLRADVPYGLLLSGGVDSSLLLALMCQVSTERPRTFSFAFNESGEGSEAAAAKLVAKRFGALHTECRKSASDIPRHLAHMVWATDDLFSDPANIPTSWLAHAAMQDEVKVVLTGEGGDECFAGYGRYRRHPLHYVVKGLMDAGCGFHLYGIFNDRTAREIFNPAVYDAARLWRKSMIEEWNAYPRNWSRLQRMQNIDIDGEMGNVLLPKVDRMLMSWGVEGRVPFLDHRVVEFAASLPDSLKVRGRIGKYFIRKWGERHLSADELWRKKSGFSVPVNEMFTDDFLDKLEHALPRNSGVRAILQIDNVKILINRQRAQGDVADQLWRIVVFALWYKIHFEGAGTRPPSETDLFDLFD